MRLLGGLNPSSKKGKHVAFSNSNWCDLFLYVIKTCNFLTKEDKDNLSCNNYDGAFFNSRKAMKIAKTLENKLNKDEVPDFLRWRVNYLAGFAKASGGIAL